jgi:hypothetical protein
MSKLNSVPPTSYLLSPRSRVIFEKLTGSQLVKKFPSFYGTLRFITAITSACHPLYPEPARSSPYPTSHFLNIYLILSSFLRLVLPSGLFPSGFPTKRLCTPLFLPIGVKCPAYLILLDLITRTILGEKYRSLSSL